jgi:hypothetical protein
MPGSPGRNLARSGRTLSLPRPRPYRGLGLSGTNVSSMSLTAWDAERGTQPPGGRWPTAAFLRAGPGKHSKPFGPQLLTAAMPGALLCKPECRA